VLQRTLYPLRLRVFFNEEILKIMQSRIKTCATQQINKERATSFENRDITHMLGPYVEDFCLIFMWLPFHVKRKDMCP
jgi:hypothetical protein